MKPEKNYVITLPTSLLKIESVMKTFPPKKTAAWFKNIRGVRAQQKA